jgi:hypothetical protein
MTVLILSGAAMFLALAAMVVTTVELLRGRRGGES